jgi:hypothetical protein
MLVIHWSSKKRQIENSNSLRVSQIMRANRILKSGIPPNAFKIKERFAFQTNTTIVVHYLG